MTDDPGPKGWWLHWLRIARFLLVATVAIASAGIVVIVMQNSRMLGQMTVDVSMAQERASNLSNAQRESLRLLVQVTGLNGSDDVPDVMVQRGLMGRQLLVSITVFPTGSTERQELRSIYATVQQFPWERLADDRASDDSIQRRAIALVSESETRLHAMYGDQEGKFYQATVKAVDAKGDSELALTLLAGLVVALGLCWVVLLKRSTRTHVLSANRALATTESRFRSLVQRASDLTAVTDAEGIVTYVSPAAETIIGIGPEQLMGGSLVDRIDSRDRAFVRAMLARLVADPSAPITIEFRVD
ncbi:MAG TPA: PAS domain S-box protein, partial [Thermomicrobiales bacterium]|nr:PAS domain S-box protein [Thermomicrobiales bacterium]